ICYNILMSEQNSEGRVAEVQDAIPVTKGTMEKLRETVNNKVGNEMVSIITSDGTSYSVQNAPLHLSMSITTIPTLDSPMSTYYFLTEDPEKGLEMDKVTFLLEPHEIPNISQGFKKDELAKFFKIVREKL